MSACVTTTPVEGASLSFTGGEPVLAGLSGGDGDPFIDNCESGTVSFAVHNDGTAALSNVRVAHVEPLSHPEIEITSAPTFAASLAPCGEAEGSFGFTAHGLAF
ncbi:MAG TPA: hypothetical protein VF100_04640, partial [Thermoanaerobaculia bacterium]